MDIERYNTDWLAAWSRKDTEALLTFYAENAIYKDAQIPAGVIGHVALRNYLNGLFAATPPMEYVPEITWPIPGGYCGRWNCDFRLTGGSPGAIRGFDLVLIEDDKITYNEVYTHNLPASRPEQPASHLDRQAGPNLRWPTVAEVAQMVEHGTENAGVPSSTLGLSTTF